MTPAIVVAFLWLLFGGSHIGLAAVRDRLVPASVSSDSSRSSISSRPPPLRRW